MNRGRCRGYSALSWAPLQSRWTWVVGFIRMPNWDRRSRADGATTLGTKAARYAYNLPSSGKVSVTAGECLMIIVSSEKILLS